MSTYELRLITQCHHLFGTVHDIRGIIPSWSCNNTMLSLAVTPVVTLGVLLPPGSIICLQGNAPAYLSAMLSPNAPRRTLRSDNQCLMKENVPD